MSKILCIDFDGVLHSYSSGWAGADVIKDPPVPGAISWLKALIADEDMDPQIYSSRSKEDAGIVAMKTWLLSSGLSEVELDKLQFPTQKPPAFLTIDDRAFTFLGAFPSVEKIQSFKPWNKKKPGVTTLGVTLMVNGAEAGFAETEFEVEVNDPDVLSYMFEGFLKKVSVNLSKVGTVGTITEDAEPT
jgi:hypothetical protein